MPRIHPVNQKRFSYDAHAVFKSVNAKNRMDSSLYSTFDRVPAILKAFSGVGDAIPVRRLADKKSEVNAIAFNRTFRQLILIGLTSIALLGVHTGANASGSYGGGSPSGIQSSYHLGKAVLYKKLVCEGCLAPMTDIDVAKASELKRQLQQKDFLPNQLSQGERQAVVDYLSKRYSLN